jgi:DNA-binding winged helix-turn-helix (wHTH) protein
MTADRQIAIGLFRFDPRNGQLWREASEVKLTPRAAAVLRMLAGRAELPSRSCSTRCGAGSR